MSDPADPTALAILGLPWDGGSSFRRGAAEAPGRIRDAYRSPAANTCAENGVDLALEERFVDLGDLNLAEIDATAGDRGGREAAAAIEDGCRRALTGGARILALGGDHSVTYPLVKAHRRIVGDAWIVHFDAHPDLYDELDGCRLSHACPFARIMEEGLARGLTQVGVRTATPHQRRQAARFGVHSHPPDAPPPELWADVHGPVYLSFDLDVLDPAFAPGVSHPEPGGLSVRETLRLLRTLPGPVVGADLVELNPRLDPAGLTAVVAAKLMKEIAARMLADLPG